MEEGTEVMARGGGASAAPPAAPGPWRQELTDLARGASGGFLFGVPMLYTMEVWWIGTHTTALQALAMVLVTAVPLFALNLTLGFRELGSVRPHHAAMDTVEALALGVVLAAAVLYLLGVVTAETPRSAAVAKVVYEAFPFCLGIGVANHFLRGSRNQDDDSGDTDTDTDTDAGDDRADAGDDDREGDGGDDVTLNATLADLGATALGAAFVALNIAPTDEVPMLGVGMSAARLLALMAATLVVTYGIVFVAGFPNQDRRHRQVGAFQRPITETVVCYLVALLCAGAMLAVFQRLDGPWPVMLEHALVLSLPAAIGGAAGRLAL